ncbi:MAG: [FeFe] hydrogenase H-cluster radical SAM maturase HydE [Rikenellaceae bacterium]
MINKIDILRNDGELSEIDLIFLLQNDDPMVGEYLAQQAREVAETRFGRRVFVRGLIEITNKCRNGCYYCGINRANREVARYSLSEEDIMECCHTGYQMGFRTFVLQGGEDPTMNIEWLEGVVSNIRTTFLDCAITLSLGEMPREWYERLYKAGANRYLLRHESYNEELYNSLHPSDMSHSNRLRSLADLKQIGFQTGTGFMVGAPNQSIDNLVEDILYIKRLSPEMIGIGPFIPHHSTALAEHKSGSVAMTLKLISILRLMHPRALIPSTTALATLSESGRKDGILAGANVVMPNLSPTHRRKEYSLYDNKAAFGAESAEGLKRLQRELEQINYEISYERGDYIQG